MSKMNNNIDFVIEEKMTEIEMLEQELSQGVFMAIVIKYNCDALNPVMPYLEIKQYLADHNIIVRYALAGLHLNGKAERPHIHYHLITDPFNIKTIKQNSSQHRKRWWDKQDKDTEPDHSFLDTTWRFYDSLDNSKPKYQTLAYPLKEGHHFYKNLKKYYVGITPTIFDALLIYGQSIYNSQVALHIRQEKCEQRKQNALTDLYEICRVENFHTFDEMKHWLDVNYIDKLDLNEMPDPHHYKNNVLKIAVKLKLRKYSDFI